MASKEWPKVEEIVNSALIARDAFLVDFAERKERGRRIVQVYIDTDDGITIAECAEISSEVGATLDAQGVINEPFELEVSSPGIDKPLKLLRQYRKNVGRKYKVQYQHENEHRSLVGTLSAIEGEKLTFVTEKQESISMDFLNIIESIEELPW